MMAISDWPQQERPREKLLAKGAQSLSDAELLALFLRTGIPGASALDLARGLLQRFGSLRGVLEADARCFCREPGMGPSRYTQLQAVLELSQRCMLENLQREDALTSAAQSRAYVQNRLRARHREVFLCLLLDSQHRVIAHEELFEGTIDGAMVHPREVLDYALKHQAAAVIFAHNHPSGIAEPSEADISITRRLKAALALVDIRTLDHLVVGDAEVVSMAERGML
tara:strand:+ start:606 stop:1283 length:678 start_codon:yes stop_codon:yes gene_type:complete